MGAEVQIGNERDSEVQNTNGEQNAGQQRIPMKLEEQESRSNDDININREAMVNAEGLLEYCINDQATGSITNTGDGDGNCRNEGLNPTNERIPERECVSIPSIDSEPYKKHVQEVDENTKKIGSALYTSYSDNLPIDKPYRALDDVLESSSSGYDEENMCSALTDFGEKVNQYLGKVEVAPAEITRGVKSKGDFSIALEGLLNRVADKTKRAEVYDSKASKEVPFYVFCGK